MRNMRNLDLAFKGMKLPGRSWTAGGVAIMIAAALFSEPRLEQHDEVVGECWGSRSQESSEALSGEVVLVVLLLDEKMPPMGPEAVLLPDRV
jgi:hypothetical protein